MNVSPKFSEVRNPTNETPVQLDEADQEMNQSARAQAINAAANKMNQTQNTLMNETFGANNQAMFNGSAMPSNVAADLQP